MADIGIIGAGIAGLQLGLFLRQSGIPTTIYSEKTAEQMRESRLPAVVTRSAQTRQRERALGIDYWDAPDFGVFCIHFAVSGPQPLAFTGHLSQPAIAVDMRIYCATLLKAFTARGGRVRIGVMQGGDLAHLADQHDLVVVSSGRGSLTEHFPRSAEHSPYRVPQRHLYGGLFRGITHTEPLGLGFTIVPGLGEIFDNPILSFEGRQSGAVIEAVPGGALDLHSQMHYAENPRRFEAAMLALIREHAPALAARIDPDVFAVTRPLDFLQGGITPTVRRGYGQLDNGRYVIALGDVHVTHDPIIGQGANAASHAAWVLGEAIRDGGPFDERFCCQVEERRWEYLGPAASWSNAMLQPPPPHVGELFAAAAQIPAVADAFAETMTMPQRGWELVSNPARTADFLAASGWHPPILTATM